MLQLFLLKLWVVQMAAGRRLVTETMQDEDIKNCGKHNTQQVSQLQQLKKRPIRPGLCA